MSELFIIEDDSDSDALSWWKLNNLKFRILSKMVCYVLSIQTIIVSYKSSFSVGGRVIDAYRSSLGAETIQDLLYAKDWMRTFYEIKRI